MKKIVLLTNKKIEETWEYNLKNDNHAKVPYFKCNMDLDLIKKNGFDVAKGYALYTGHLKHKNKKLKIKAICEIEKLLNDIKNLYLEEEMYDQWEYYTGEFFSKAENKNLSLDENYTLNFLNAKLLNYLHTKEYNLCISQIMLAVADFKKMKSCSYTLLRRFAVLISPFFPYLSEKVWNSIMGKDSVFLQMYPIHDEFYCKKRSHEYPVFVDGRKEFYFTKHDSITDETNLQFFKDSPLVYKKLDGRIFRKAKFIPNKCFIIETND